MLSILSKKKNSTVCKVSINDKTFITKHYTKISNSMQNEIRILAKTNHYHLLNVYQFCKISNIIVIIFFIDY